MLAYQAACLGVELKHRQARRVIHIQRCVQQVVDALVQALPLVGLQLSVQNLRALYLTGVADEAVHQLHVRHLKREEGHGHPQVSGDVLGH